MGIKIKTVAEAIEDNGIKMLVHGPAGVGKTVLCATSGLETLIISAEAGLLSIAEAPSNIHVSEEISSIDDLEEYYDYLTGEGEGLYDLVCLDSVSEIAEVLLAEEKSRNKDARAAYGNLSERMTKIMRMFRDLPNIHVLFTCKQKRQEDSDTGIVMYVPSLPGAALTQSIAYLFDEVFALRVEQDVDEEGNKFDYRILQCDRDRKYECKDRSGNLDQFEEPSLKDILAKILGDKDAKKVEAEVEKTDEVDEVEEAKPDGDDVANQAEPETEEESRGEADSDGTSEDSTASEDSSAEEQELDIAPKKLYWTHETGSCGVIEKGEEYNQARYEEGGAEFVTLGAYKKFLAENPQDED